MLINYEDLQLKISNGKGEYYTLSKGLGSKENLWLCTQDGEGMDAKITALYDVIDKFFKKNM